MHGGVPDLDRYSALHPAHRAGRSGRERAHDHGGEPDGRQLRPRLPDLELCEGACVYAPDNSPIRIGQLQQHATDWLIADGRMLFTPGPPTGKRVAIVGGGPAGLSAARDLARIGHAVTVFERDELAGGLNTYGIVPFRLPVDVAVWEAEQVRRLGVDIKTGVTVGTRRCGRDSSRAEYDAVMIACGMGKVPQLGIEGQDAAGVWDALDFIRTAKIDGVVPGLGDTVAIIGGGNTAIDAATASKRLGARSVTMYYRRGPERMTAYEFEIEFAKLEGVEFRFNVLPKRILTSGGCVSGLRVDPHRSRRLGAADPGHRARDLGRQRDPGDRTKQVRGVARRVRRGARSRHRGGRRRDAHQRTRGVCRRRLHVPSGSQRRNGRRSRRAR